MKQRHQVHIVLYILMRRAFKIWQSLVKVLLNNGKIIKIYLIGNRLLFWI